MRPTIAAFLALAAGLAAAPAAHAKGAKATAKLTCGIAGTTDADRDTVVTKLPARGKPRLTGPILCTLEVTGFTGDGSYMGTLTSIRTMRTIVDPATGKKHKEIGAAVSGEVDGNTAHLVATFVPAEVNAATAFLPCEDFDVEAAVGDASAMYFTQVIHIQQKCPKPKKLAATVACYVSQHGGTSTPLAKVQDELLAAEGIGCVVNSKDDRLIQGDTKVTGQFRWHDPASDNDKDGAVRTGSPGADEGVKFQQIDFTPDDYDHCNASTVTILVVDGAGGVIFAKAIKVQPECGAGE
jgi:hypothetical protein